ncbi:hypothetical protein CXB51_027330 [Gossypium anomalum]|uniref:Integrase catalytic domain-containing protein n=1 Tax=Gossypium anomalum TaxID=47600 RepID=A0A8J5YTS7_9ROSI|nr:hypothetical protein CXB51_027330 [Gossypium anomalum]
MPETVAGVEYESLTTHIAPLQLIVSDVWGPAPVTSDGFCYYVAFTDVYTRYTWVYVLKQKSKVLTVFPQFHRQVERVLGCRLQALQSDRGGEFHALKQIVETGLSMLVHATMPLSYWRDTFSTAVYLINRLPSSPLNQFRSTPCTFLGYSPMHKGYRCQDVNSSLSPPSSNLPDPSSPQPLPDQNPSTTFLPHNSYAMVKRNADGTVDRYKARLVAKGFSQHAGLDFRDTFSPVVRAVTIRTVLALAVMKGWSLRQVDVNNAFLNGVLTEKVYMSQPPGFDMVAPNGQQLVCKLNKALYGLRQAPRAWFQTLKHYLVAQLGFRASKADLSLFIRATIESSLLLMAYVNDIIITGSSTNEIDTVVQQLHRQFTLKDMGQLYFFLGVSVHHTSQGLLLSQKKYITDILHKTGMSGASTTPTPMVSTPKLVASDDSPPFADGPLYRSIVGMLQYVCITRPDLSFCVNKLSQYMNAPSEAHWKAVKRVLRYLLGTLDHGLFFSKGQFELVGYSDADWASSVEDRRSTTGYVIYLGSNPIAWCSKKQPVVSRSSSEAEYRSLANCVAELLWVKQLLDELGMSPCQFPVVWCDNTSTMSMAANPTHHARVKHIEIDHHFIREKVLDGTLLVNFVPSDKQVADVLTKPITPKQFATFCRALCVLSSTDFLFQQKELRKPGEC